MSDELRKAAQDVVDAWDAYCMVGGGDIAPLRAALATCPDCGKPAPEGSIHTCSPQKPDSDAKQRLLEIMRRNGLATGHGDTLKQVIDTLEVELTDMLAKARQDAARYRWVRDHASRDWLDWGITDHDVDAAMQGDNNGT